MRERIVEAAAELFYAQGLRAVSAEKIIAPASVAARSSTRPPSMPTRAIRSGVR
jgi:AcrR family transcriptional regulator